MTAIQVDYQTTKMSNSRLQNRKGLRKGLYKGLSYISWETGWQPPAHLQSLGKNVLFVAICHKEDPKNQN